MFSETLLEESLIKIFYVNHRVVPGHNNVLDQEDFLKIVFDGIDKSKAFGHFVLESFGAVGHNEYVLNFQSWNELFDCYYSFMGGFIGNKS